MRFLLGCGVVLGLATAAYAQSSGSVSGTGTGSNSSSGTGTGTTGSGTTDNGTGSMTGSGTSYTPSTTDTRTDSMGNNIYDSKGRKAKVKTHSGQSGSDSSTNSEGTLPGSNSNNSSTQGR